MVPVFLAVCCLGPAHGVLHLVGELVGAADVGHADVVGVHALDVGDEVALEELHEEADLGLGAAQIVFEREGVEGDPGDVDARGGFDDVLDGFGALLMAEEALEGALAGPAAVAVHDDGDVLREAREVEGVVDRALFGRELVGPVGALIGAAGGGVWHVRLAVMRIDDARERGTAMRRIGKVAVTDERCRGWKQTSCLGSLTAVDCKSCRDDRFR